MEEFIHQYKRLLLLLAEEQDNIKMAIDGELQEEYIKILNKEREAVENNIKNLFANT